MNYYNDNDPQAVAKRPRIADLFCGAGGAAMGLHRAGFEVTGFDIKKQPRYPFEFHQADALTVDLIGFDAVWASPPCQAHTNMLSRWGGEQVRARHKNLIPQTRETLERSGLPYIIENVYGSPLLAQTRLCGTAFGLGTTRRKLVRHRFFEANFTLDFAPPCQHDKRPAIAVYGHAGGRSARDEWRNGSTDEWREAMGIDWMTGTELAQAIPPIYSEFLGRQLIKHVSTPRPSS